MSIVWYFAALVVLIALSAFFSASEMSYSSANRLRLENAAEDGDRRAKTAVGILDHFDRTLSAILIGNNLVNIAASSLGSVIVILLAGEQWTWVSTVVLTLLVIIFGETMPKIVAKQNANGIALRNAYVIRALSIVLYPVIWLVVGLVHLITRPLRGDTGDGDPEEAVSSETAYVMNKLLQDVVNNGTGQKAKLENKHVAGKTGTTQDWNDLTFVGLTEDFVSGVWLGYKERSELKDHHIKSAQIWYNIIGEYADSMDTGAEYPENDKVIEGKVCARSGKIAGPNCEATTTGYWKSSNAPVCDECGKYSKSTKATGEQEEGTSETTAAGEQTQANHENENGDAATEAATQPAQTQAAQ